MKICRQCSNDFEITDADRAFYKRFDVPDPLLCPPCRERNRLAFRNEAHFYKRDCGLCKKSCISMYSKDKPWIVYCLKCWWSDQYDPLKYGRDYDFNRPFFEQYYELAKKVPKPAIMNMKSENCDYTNYSAENRNGYLLTGTLRSEDCYYSDRLFYCKNVLDSYDLHRCEVCYECILCTNCYNCQFCQSCDNCSECFFCEECTGCTNCFGCINLKNKKYHIFNQPYSKENYEKKSAELLVNPSEIQHQMDLLKKQVPRRAAHLLNCENSTGDQLVNCKHCLDCHTVKNSEECRYLFTADGSKFCFDCDYCDNCELHLNSAFLEQNYDVMGGCMVWYCKNIRYATNCFSSSNLFGCIGTKQNQYCILNRQYSREEYEKLAPKIIEHMKSAPQPSPKGSGAGQAGEWGNYYPLEHSPFAYNETVAQEHYPLTKEEVLARGLQWKEPDDDMPKVTRIIPAQKLPARITDIPDDVLNWAIRCEATGRPFKILPQELRFYRENDLPIPHFHPAERHERRYAQRNPRKLYDRLCAQCQAAIKTSYAPDRPEIVYCESCYLKTVY